ncbi:MAG: HAMP domain-containing histidine kinase, partial [Bacteroidia bacterium]|nr:HAMP domain-containing histidine kinase [Bacteroidia bacterium]
RENEQEKRNRHIEKIKSSVKQLNDILEDFLSLGKLDEGKVEVQTTLFDLDEFINETVEDMKGLFKKDQQIIYDHVGENKVISDKKMLKNILINLISNAIKFSEERAIIEIKSIGKDSVASIAIKDQGIGISEEDQKHLFTSFFRGKNATNIKGTGLGLHIVKRYVDLLGGDIYLHSELDKGTTIRVNIPIK